MSDTKICTNGDKVPGCGRDLPLSEFPVSPNGARTAPCKDCRRKQRRLNRAIKACPFPLDEPTHATCPQCQENLPIDRFPYEKGSGGVRKPLCTQCLEANRKKAKAEKISRENLERGPLTGSDWTKACPRCCRELPIEAFSVELSRPDGRSNRCRECRKLNRNKKVTI